MAKLAVGKIHLDTTSAPVVCVLYSLGALVVFVLFRFVYPDFDRSEKLLDIFWFKARLSWGLLTYITMFPAVFMSALVIPFALRIQGKAAEKRFSQAFFDLLKPNLACCIAGAVFYALLFLTVYPLLSNYHLRIQSESRLYISAREKAERFAAEEKWSEAADFFAVCEYIWPDNAALSSLQDKIVTGLEWLRYGRDTVLNSQNPAAQREAEAGRSTINLTESLSLAQTALREKRYYDAHWLASTAGRLARPGSVEAAEAARTASLAWNALSRVEPSSADEALFSLYRRKREGYEALVNGEALRAYYIFNALLNETPQDPEVRQFLYESEQGLLSTSFFLDEMDMIVGDIQNDVVLSIPADGRRGRMVLRFDTLTAFADSAFGQGLEGIGFSAQNELAWRLSSSVAKIFPISINGEWCTAIFLRAVDRQNSSVRREPVWTGASGLDSGQLLLPIPFEKFLLAASARDGFAGFFIHDLQNAATTLSDAGYVPQFFQAEITRVIAELAFFLPLSVFALIAGWKYRAQFRVHYALLPMFAVLPMVFSLVAIVLRFVCNTIIIWAVISYGVGTAIVLAAGSAALLFVTALFILAAQRSDV